MGRAAGPKDIHPGERRPVLVCQHGRQGVPKDVIETEPSAYNRFAARLAKGASSFLHRTISIG